MGWAQNMQYSAAQLRPAIFPFLLELCKDAQTDNSKSFMNKYKV